MFSEKDYALLPPFNWDTKDYQECAALHLADRAITIMHVVSVLDNNSLVYRAKALFPSPRSILESPDYHDRDTFSMTFRDASGGIWKSDCDSQLESTIADPAFYRQPHTETAPVLEELAEQQAALDAALERWTELEG